MNWGMFISAFDQMFGQITEAIATRKQSENRFRTLVEQAADAFFVVEFRAGRVIDVNQSACHSLGYDRASLLQLSVPDIQTAINAEEFQRLWQRLQPGDSPNRGRLASASGWVLLSGVGEVRLGLLETNQHRYILALARDITESAKPPKKPWPDWQKSANLAAMIVHESCAAP